MGRPRLHDEDTRAELLATAERLVAEGGPDALSVRTVAEGAGTTTRAVYSLFGSKGGLVQALAQHTYQLLMDRVAAVPLTDDPRADLVTGSVDGFRAFTLEHPDLFLHFFSIQRPALNADAESTRQSAYGQLVARVARARDAGCLGTQTIERVTLLLDVMCSGLALREICGRIDRDEAELVWTESIGALLDGLRSAD